MKASSNFKKVAPSEYAKARETVHIVDKTPSPRPIDYRNHLSYNAKDPKNYSIGSKRS